MIKTLLVSLLLFAAVECPLHSGSSCYPTGQYHWNGPNEYQKYHCSCGDDVWVKEN